MTTVPDQQPTADTPLEHALALAALGIRVLPIRPGSKRPPMNSWQHAATNDPDKIANWYRGLYKDAGVGLALGDQPNGLHLFAIDLDDHGSGNGHDELADLEREHGKLPDTWRSITGSGNGHLIFATTTARVRNQQAAGNRVAPNIDVRGQGGQIVVAPTLHPDTLNAYAWEHGFEPWSIPVAVLPDDHWLIELVREPDATPAPPPAAPQTPSGGTVFDLHRDDWSWHTELARLGWKHVKTDANGDSYWLNPNSGSGADHSAVLHGADGPLVVWSTSIPEAWTQAASRTADGSGWSFGPFGFYAATRHAGDRSQAARALHDHYGVEMGADVALGDLIAPGGDTTPAPVDPDDFDARLMAMLIDWHEFASTDFQAEAWLWEPIIPAGRATAIFAKGGTGKSLVVLRMVVDLCLRGVKVLYLDYEMTPDDLDDRLSNMGIDDPTVLDGTLHYALLPSLDAFDTPEGGRQVRRMAELVKAELVVIDTFARAVEGDENDADTVRDFYRMTGLHLKADGRGFIRVDHAGKDGTKGQRGTSAKNDDVDLVWELRRTEDGYRMVRGKCRMGWVPEAVNLERTDDPLTVIVKGGDSYPPGTAELANELERLGIPAEWGERKVRQDDRFKASGNGARNDRLRAAQKYRRKRSESYHLVDDLVAKPTPAASPDLPY